MQRCATETHFALAIQPALVSCKRTLNRVQSQLCMLHLPRYTIACVLVVTTPSLSRSREEIVKEGDNLGNCPICLLEIETGSTVVYLGCDHCYQ